MNKLVGAAVLSLGLSVGAQNASAGDYGAAFLSGNLYDVVLEGNGDKAKPRVIQTQTPSPEKPREVQNQNITPKKKPQNNKISRARKKTNYEVAQIVGDKFIFTTQSTIKTIPTYDCREHDNYRYYFSEERYIIPTDNFTQINQEQVKKILSLPNC